MRLRFSIGVLGVLGIFFNSASAHAEGTPVFSYSDGETLNNLIGLSPDKHVFSAWNAKVTQDSHRLRDPGLQVLFWGRGEECDINVSNGPVTGDAKWVFGAALNRTGLPLDDKISDLRWSPLAGEGCSADSKGKAGPSFVHINEEAMKGGIGIYTNSGGTHSKENDRYFFRQFDEQGQNGKGANKGISGTFVTFRFDWKTEDPRKLYRPFRDAGGTSNSSLVIETLQTVKTVHVPASADSRTKSPNQVKQQFAMTLANRYCLSKKIQGALCQIKYLFHTALVREGVRDWDRELWFDKASLLLDPAQGGLPVFNGPLKNSGVETMSREAPGISLWTSLGSPTLHKSFDNVLFRVEVTRKQLIDGMKVAAARMSRDSYKDVTNEQLVQTFGEKWGDVNEWVILDINVAQEVHNTNLDNDAWIGGNIHSITVFENP